MVWQTASTDRAWAFRKLKSRVEYRGEIRAFLCRKRSQLLLTWACLWQKSGMMISGFIASKIVNKSGEGFSSMLRAVAWMMPGRDGKAGSLIEPKS